MHEVFLMESLILLKVGLKYWSEVKNSLVSVFKQNSISWKVLPSYLRVLRSELNFSSDTLGNNLITLED
ncbi:hypothetical protein DWB61_08690 [Ancylomarina euxinus]|uniref:Uncharacterized protein n=1 Tax=Ancylomarina euxinus TaxID=2283627 RepID=A0A425Y1R0_9BACT|nr:hypothetical protein DWB61_08690 [Ancylomarina euxinus]